jgi:LytS/YehU family sensor histidine kinase
MYFNNAILLTVIFYLSILGATYILDSRRRLADQQMETARLNEQLSKAQLDALRHQIEPHFLFNALNAVASLVRENRNDDAVGMIAGLSDLLRHVLHDSRRQQVPLGEELDVLEKYMAIQKVRFSDRLHVELNIPTDLLPAQIPSLLLQPLVENALKHGVSKWAQGGWVRIAASRENDNLTLSVYNDGPELSPDWKTISPGVGLSNLQNRLESLYGKRFQFELASAASGGVEARVSIPYTLAGEEKMVEC